MNWKVLLNRSAVMLIIVGDFNVDFDRGGAQADLLNDFADELDLLACDLHFRESVMYTKLVL